MLVSLVTLYPNLLSVFTNFGSYTLGALVAYQYGALQKKNALPG